MRRTFFISLILLVSFSCFAQSDKLFTDAELGLAFNASSSWKQLDSAGDHIMKLVNCNNNLEVSMWVDQDRKVKNKKKYLSKLAASEGLVSENGPFKTQIAGEEGAAVLAVCCEKRKPVRILIVAFERDNILHLVRFRCPEECYEQHQGKIKKLIGAVSVLPKEESFHHYASIAQHS